MWTGCGQRAVYTTRKHGGLADWAITELEALLDSVFLFSAAEFLKVSQERVLLTLYLDYTLGLLHRRAVFPKDLEWTTPWGSLLQGCFQTQQGITASSSFLQMRN